MPFIKQAPPHIPDIYRRVAQVKLVGFKRGAASGSAASGPMRLRRAGVGALGM